MHAPSNAVILTANIYLCALPTPSPVCPPVPPLHG